jgi:hypothetical protein
MVSAESVAVLNRVLAILRSSFPQYLRYARPYVPASRRDALQRIHHIAAAEDALAERVAGLVVEAEVVPDPGEFPMEFTDAHDLGLDYIIREAVGYQKQDIAALEELSKAANLGSAAGPLVAEALNMAREHLQVLEELQAQPGASTIVRDGAPAYEND